MIFDMLAQEVADVRRVSSTTTTITGVDGNDITLYLSRPVDAAGQLPAVVHLHGGGMAIASAADLGYIRLREHLAATGLVVVGVEFRNSSAKLGPHRIRPGSTTVRRPLGGSAATATRSASPISSRPGNPAAAT